MKTWSHKVVFVCDCDASRSCDVFNVGGSVHHQCARGVVAACKVWIKRVRVERREGGPTICEFASLTREWTLSQKTQDSFSTTRQRQ